MASTSWSATTSAPWAISGSALEQTEDFATAERLGIEFGEDFRLLEDIGWNGRDGRNSFDLTMPAHDLTELLQRLHDEARRRFSGVEAQATGRMRAVAGSSYPASAPEKRRCALRSQYGEATQRDIHFPAS